MLDLYLYDARKWKNKDLGNLPTEVEDYLLCHNKDIVSRIAYLLLYKLLKDRYHLKKIKFVFEGKPRLSNNRLHFNISHTKHFVCIIISSSSVGVDIEYANRKVSDNLYKRTLHEEEKILFNYKNDRCYIISFVKKESHLKRLGTGINCELKSLSSLRLKDCKLFIEHKNNLLLSISTLLKEKVIIHNCL